MQLWILRLWAKPELLKSKHIHHWLQVQQVHKTRGYIVLKCRWEQIYPGRQNPLHSHSLLLQALLGSIAQENQTSLPKMWPQHWNSLQAKDATRSACFWWTKVTQFSWSFHHMQIWCQDSGLAAFFKWRIAGFSFHPMSKTEKTISSIQHNQKIAS